MTTVDKKLATIIINATARVNDEPISANGLSVEVDTGIHAQGGMPLWFETASAAANAISNELGYRDQVVIDGFEVIQDLLPMEG